MFEEEGKTWVYVKNGSSYDKRAVVLDQRNDNFVVVKKGLSAGDEVALRNPEQKSDEQADPEMRSTTAPSAAKES